MTYAIHRFLRNTQLMFARLPQLHGPALWLIIALLTFALLFLVIGLTRIVEFKGLGLSYRRRTILTALHILGCITFSLMFVLFAIDINKTYSDLLAGLLISSLILLFPIHIYAGILRNIRLRQKN